MVKQLIILYECLISKIHSPILLNGYRVNTEQWDYAELVVFTVLRKVKTIVISKNFTLKFRKAWGISQGDFKEVNRLVCWSGS